MAISLANVIVRGFQFLFAIVVLGLSVSLIRDHHWGSLPATLGFAAFVAAISIIGALIGLAATWVSLLEGPIGLIIDGLVALINLAGGVVVLVKLKGASCTGNGGSEDNAYKLAYNDMLNGGCLSDDICYWFDQPGKIISHCKESQADAVFMFLTVALLIVSAVLTFLRMRKGY